MHTVFLLGNIASGKSTAARYLEGKGALRIDLDQWAKSLYQPGSNVVSELVEAFGFDILDKDGGIKPAALATRAFETPEATAVLDGIVHPRLIEKLSAALLPPVCCSTMAPAHPFAVVEVSAPRGFEDAFGLADEVMTVSVPLDERRRRARARGMSEEDFERRASVQPSEQDLCAMADVVIDNSGTAEELEARLDAWLIERGLLAEGASR